MNREETLAEHDRITRLYYVEGNPEGWSEADWIRIHDSLWTELSHQEGGIDDLTYEVMVQDIENRASRTEIQTEDSQWK